MRENIRLTPKDIKAIRKALTEGALRTRKALYVRRRNNPNEYSEGIQRGMLHSYRQALNLIRIYRKHRANVNQLNALRRFYRKNFKPTKTP